MRATPGRGGPIVIGALSAVVWLTAPAAATHPKVDPAIATGASPRALVRFAGDVTPPTLARLMSIGITKAAVFDAIDVVAVEGSIEQYDAIARWPDVLGVDDDSPVVFHTYVSKRDLRVTPVHRGRALRSPYTGEGVTVAFFDTGVESGHPDLTGVVANVHVEPWLLDLLPEATYTPRATERPVGVDPLGHGTAIAGIIGGNGALGVGADTRGIAPGASMINLFTDVTADYSSDRTFETMTLTAFQWILDHQHDPRFPGGIRVVNNSWGMPGEIDPATPLVLMIREMVARGIVVVFAAGNSGPVANSVDPYPNSMEEVITVGAVCKSDQPVEHPYWDPECRPGGIWFASSRGPEVDVVAPGVRIWTTKAHASDAHLDSLRSIGWGSALGPAPGDGDPAATANRVWYVPKWGTSFAAPHVVGVVALMLEANPALTPAAVECLLIHTATDAGDPGSDPDYGHGLVDAHRAVRAAERWRPHGSFCLA